MEDTKIAEKYLRKVQEAERRGIEFSLPLTSFINVCRSKRCYYTKQPLTPENFSIDRIDSSKGYVKGNCVACCKDFNAKKGGLGLDELKVLIKVLTKRGLL